MNTHVINEEDLRRALQSATTPELASWVWLAIGAVVAFAVLAFMCLAILLAITMVRERKNTALLIGLLESIDHRLAERNGPRQPPPA